MGTEIVKGKLLGVDRIGPSESALVIEIHEPLRPVSQKKVPLGACQVTPDWMMKNMGLGVECVVVNGTINQSCGRTDEFLVCRPLWSQGIKT